APTVTIIFPTVGSLTGGELISIVGTNLGTAATTTVQFGSTPAAIIFDNGTQLSAIAPPEAAGKVDITVTTPDGTSATSPADLYTYTAAPIVSSLSATLGTTAGGDTVTIYGSNLA